MLRKNKMTSVVLLSVILLVIIIIRLNERPGFYTLPKRSEELKTLIPIARKELDTFTSSWVNFEPHLSMNGIWKIIPINTLGIWSSYAPHFPQTCKALQKIDFRNAMFSKLEPNVKLKPHQGYAFIANDQLRCHLILRSNSKCKIIVNGISKSMETGNVIIFDDSKEHSAENNGIEDRLVLIVDIPRPHHIPKGTSTTPISSNLLEAAAEIGLSVQDFEKLSKKYQLA